MDIKERLSLFQGLVNCNYKVNLWTYDDNLNLLDSKYHPDMPNEDTVTMLNLTSAIKAHTKAKNPYPLMLDTDFGLVWIAAFEYFGEDLHRTHIIGPAFTGKDSHLLIKKKLSSYTLSVKLQMEIVKQIENVTIIPMNTLLQFATMLHYCVTNEQIAIWQVCVKKNDDVKQVLESTLGTEEHKGIWLNEQNFLKMIREGNPDYKKVLETSITLSNGIKADFNDSLRHHKNNVHTLLTLCSRASIEGGLAPSIAYSLNDYYAKFIEDCKNVAETSNVAYKLMDDYVERVRQTKEVSNISGQILEVCNYIMTNVKEKLMLSDLAEKVGYSEYYLSYKFKQEMGKNINEYIREKKIEEAKLLLSGTKMSILEISLELSFGNRSYFYSSFQKQTGMSPSEYRTKYYKS